MYYSDHLEAITDRIKVVSIGPWPYFDRYGPIVIGDRLDLIVIAHNNRKEIGSILIAIADRNKLCRSDYGHAHRNKAI